MKVYIIRNKEGKYFRPIGRSGMGENWVELNSAKIYTKIGPAKGQCTWFFSNYPKFGCPELLEFDIDPQNATVLDLTTETEKKIKQKKAAQLKSQLEYQKYEQDRLYREKAEIEAKIKAIDAKIK